MNAKYDDDKMNPFMSNRSECECFVGPEIPSYTLPLPRTRENYTGPLISFVIRIRCHIRITDKFNLSFKLRFLTRGMWHANAIKNGKSM